MTRRTVETSALCSAVDRTGLWRHASYVR